MGKNIIDWESDTQFSNTLDVMDITKLRYGYNHNDYIILTEEKEFDWKYIPETGETLKGDNQKVEYVSDTVRFRFSNLKDKNHMSSDLYFQKIDYHDFFNGFQDKKEIETTTLTTLGEDATVYEEFDAFFMSLDPDIEINEEEYTNLTYGFHSYNDEYHYYKNTNY